MKLKSIKGEFVSHSEESLSLKSRGAPVTVAESDVYRVTSRERSHRKRNALIGAGIGAAAMIPALVFCNGYTRNEGGDCAKADAIALSLGIGAGAGIGAANPGYKTIYRARGRPKQ